VPLPSTPVPPQPIAPVAPKKERLQSTLKFVFLITVVWSSVLVCPAITLILTGQRVR
jgi:hypothetical protein